MVPKAVAAARRRAQQADVDATFFEGDVAALSDAGVGSGFSLFLDVECFNHLDDAQREAVGRHVDAIATADATILLLAWVRAPRGPLPPGASPEDVQAAFPNWKITQQRPYVGEMPFLLRNVAPCWYRLVRS